MSEKLYLYPASIRIWHLVNAVLIILLIITGVNLQYASKEFMIIPFETAVSIHNVCGVLLSFNYLHYIIASIVTRNFKFYNLFKPGFRANLLKQAHFYIYGLFKGEPHPFHATKAEKFNPLQKIAYWFVMVIFLPLAILTGWFLLYPDSIAYVLAGIHLLHFTIVIHIIAGFMLSVFLIVHIYLCTVGMKWSDAIKTISTGYHHPLPEEE